MHTLYDYSLIEDEQNLIVVINPASLLLEWNGSDLKLRRSKASRYLVELLLHPYQAISAVALHALVNNALPRLNSAEQLGTYSGTVSTSFHNLLPQPLCDAETIKAVKQRMNLLIARLAEAEDWNDLARKEELEAELDTLQIYLRDSLSHKNAQLFCSDMDYKCRDNVYQSLRQLLKLIKRNSPALGVLLESSLHLWSELVFIPVSGFSVIVMESKD